MQRYGALIIALELILQKNSIFGFLFGNGLSSLVGNFVTNRRNNVCISSRIHIGCINKVTIASGVLIAGNVINGNIIPNTVFAVFRNALTFISPFFINSSTSV